MRVARPLSRFVHVVDARTQQRHAVARAAHLESARGAQAQVARHHPGRHPHRVARERRALAKVELGAMYHHAAALARHVRRHAEARGVRPGRAIEPP
ncbi:MAG: hypothetical protein U1F11_05110 [Steroidobacteraceae bacterium]